MFDIKNEKQLENFIILKTSEEFSNLSEECYYPKTGSYHKDLLHYTGTTDKELVAESKKKYKNPKFKILHYPNNALLLELILKYIDENNLKMALYVTKLMTLRFYSISMHKYIPYCKKEYFKVALSLLSQNHLYKKHDTIAGSLLFLSNTLFKKYYNDLKTKDPEKISKFVYELRHRIFQSSRSFGSKFHQAIKDEQSIKTDDDTYKDPTKEIKIKVLSDKLAKEITLYHKFDPNVVMEVVGFTKFNRKLAMDYAKAIQNVKYTDNLVLLFGLFLNDMMNKEIPFTKENIIDYVKKLMSIKYTNKAVYFKGVLTYIHDEIIKDLYLDKWFEKLSIQSKGLSRRFLAYYIILLGMKDYI